MRLIIVSGRSGSGKSTALDVLEDNGFYCIDNLPAGLLPELAERALIHTELAQPQVAVSIDARNLPSHLSRFPQLLAEMRAKHIQCDVLYLDADEETLLKRFSETRRRHPLSNSNRSLAEAIRVESDLLGPIVYGRIKIVGFQLVGRPALAKHLLHIIRMFRPHICANPVLYGLLERMGAGLEAFSHSPAPAD